MDLKKLTQQERAKYKECSSQLLFEAFMPPGDCVTLTAAVRDIHLAYPSRFQTGVRLRHTDLFLNNPYITPLKLGQGLRIPVHYDRIRREGTYEIAGKGPKTLKNKSNLGYRMIDGYRDYISIKLGIPIPPTNKLPDFYFTEEELNTRPFRDPYVVMFAGGKHDFDTKWWNPDKYQKVSKSLDIQVVQVGREKDFHIPMQNVINLIGKTSLRELMVLIKHASCVICPITCGLHIAAGCETPCVVIMGGREPPSWYGYPKQTYIHTIGQLPCCEKSCWTTKMMSCPRLIKGTPIDQPECMDMIMPKHVVSAVKAHLNGQGPKEIIVRRKTSGKQPVMPKKRKNIKYPMTIATLLYGDHHDLHKRCLESVIRHTDSSKFKLRVGCNAVCRDTLRWLKKYIEPRFDTKLYVSDENLKKYPMMRKMLRGKGNSPDTDWIVWLDDDSWITNSSWLPTLEKDICNNPNVHNFGKLYYYHIRGTMMDWMAQASWYRGKKFQIDPRVQRPRIFFCTGGFWAVSREALVGADLPDPRASNRFDIYFGAALYQNGYEIKRTNAVRYVKISNSNRRGVDEKIPGVE